MGKVYSNTGPERSHMKCPSDKVYYSTVSCTVYSCFMLQCRAEPKSQTTWFVRLGIVTKGLGVSLRGYLAYTRSWVVRVCVCVNTYCLILQRKFTDHPPL